MYKFLNLTIFVYDEKNQQLPPQITVECKNDSFHPDYISRMEYNCYFNITSNTYNRISLNKSLIFYNESEEEVFTSLNIYEANIVLSSLANLTINNISNCAWEEFDYTTFNLEKIITKDDEFILKGHYIGKFMKNI